MNGNALLLHACFAGLRYRMFIYRYLCGMNDFFAPFCMRVCRVAWSHCFCNGVGDAEFRRHCLTPCRALSVLLVCLCLALLCLLVGSVLLFACCFVCLFGCLFVCLSVCLFVCLFVSLCVCSFGCLFVLLACSLVCLSVCLFVCLLARVSYPPHHKLIFCLHAWSWDQSLSFLMTHGTYHASHGSTRGARSTDSGILCPRLFQQSAVEQARTYRHHIQ